jgi:hypothetical protein
MSVSTDSCAVVEDSVKELTPGRPDEEDDKGPVGDPDKPDEASCDPKSIPASPERVSAWAMRGKVAVASWTRALSISKSGLSLCPRLSLFVPGLSRAVWASEIVDASSDTLCSSGMLSSMSDAAVS